MLPPLPLARSPFYGQKNKVERKACLGDGRENNTPLTKLPSRPAAEANGIVCFFRREGPRDFIYHLRDARRDARQGKFRGLWFPLTRVTELSIVGRMFLLLANCIWNIDESKLRGGST